MDKINNISFTGIRNIGYIKYKRLSPVVAMKSRSLSMVLSDDYNGKDLTEFLDVLKKIPRTQYGYQHPESKDILNIECATFNDYDTLLINGKPIKVDDEHLPMFSYIAKLTRKIAGLTDEQMVVNETYKECAADELLVFGKKVSEMQESQNSEQSLDYFLNRNVARMGAKRVNSFIQNIMKKRRDTQ